MINNSPVRTATLFAAVMFLVGACGVGQEPVSAAPDTDGRSSYLFGAEQLDVRTALPMKADSTLEYRFHNATAERTWVATSNGEGAAEFFATVSPELKAQLKTQLAKELLTAPSEANAEFLQAQQGLLEFAENGSVLTCGDHYSYRGTICFNGRVLQAVYWCHGYFWQSCSCAFSYYQNAGVCG